MRATGQLASGQRCFVRGCGAGACSRLLASWQVEAPPNFATHPAGSNPPSFCAQAILEAAMRTGNRPRRSCIFLHLLAFPFDFFCISLYFLKISCITLAETLGFVTFLVIFLKLFDFLCAPQMSRHYWGKSTSTHLQVGCK